MSKRKAKDEEMPKEDSVVEESGGVEAPVGDQTVEQLARERDELLGKFQRAAADLQNYQKRVVRERGELVRQTQMETIERFLFPVIDDIDRAIQAANEHGYDEKDALFSGLTMVYQRMLELLKQYGIETIDALGRPFDPVYHQAVMERPSDEHEDGMVMQVLARGYTADGKTVRPARVIVARRAQDQPDEAADDSEPSV